MIAITNGKVLTITQGTFDPGTVLIDNGRIVAVGQDIDIPAEAQVMDATGKIVMPGLIDAHCHVGLFPDGIGWEYADGNEMTDPITPHLRALDAVHPNDPAFPELVAAGVTTVNTGPGSANLIGGQWVCLKTVPKPSIEEMVLLEPAGMKMALGENPRRVYGDQHKAPSTRMGNAGELRAALVDAQNYLDKWTNYQDELGEYEAKVASSGEDAKDAKKPQPPERDLKLEALGRVLRREMKARIHVHRADDMLTAIRIAEEFNLDLTLEHATEGHKIPHILAEKGIPVTAGPILFSRMKYELKDMTPRNPGVMARAGVKVAIQTDEASAVKYLPINAALAVREGMPEEDALKAITIHPAEIIGVADRVGSLEVGKDADVVVFSGHPFDYCTVAELVLVNGEVAYRRLAA
ncbi:MAG: amidohydrolase [Chloroflexi bacterium]|nr:amidohydrolase [Chloroflexota bacterium]MBU1748228.1 amidohydrolase [Chloroflexota bacterium]MBU1877411.1 amidohydrolase [Chloroflexota bacterium]